MEDRYPRYENGILTCKFKRPILTKVEDDGITRIFDFKRDDYHILLAGGRLSKINSGKYGTTSEKSCTLCAHSI